MKRFKNLSMQKKRILAISAVAVAVLAIGATIAYNSESVFFANLFNIDDRVDSFSEEFKTPTNWKPCDETTKTATATNHKSYPRYARMRYVEYWRTKNTTTPESDHETTDLPLTWNDNGTEKKYAIVNTQNESDWRLDNDGWYYYKTTVGEEETTSSLLKSVTFNCEVNLVGGEDYSQDGKSVETIPSDYAGAIFHIYVEFEMSDEDQSPARRRIYDQVASETRGIDSNVDFSDYSLADYDNGNGVNTLAAHANDSHPVYYYRGEVYNNNVLMNNYCWKILRTTGTGGTKLIYAGEPTEVNGVPVCNNTGEAVQVSGRTPYYGTDSTYDHSCFYDLHSIGQIGYMNSNRYLVRCHNYAAEQLTFGNDVTYENGQYTLKDTVSGQFFAIMSDVSNNKHYFCPDGGTTCENVYYMYGVIPGDYNIRTHAIEFTGGGKIDDENGAFPNDTDSAAKTTVENWFENSGMTNIEANLEDTIYCNDRTSQIGVFESKDAPVMATTTDRMYFGAGYRNTVTYKPSVDCAKKRDSFTKTETPIGNGKLKHKVGLITDDELTLSGMPYCKAADVGRIFLHAEGRDSWTMSPSFHDLGSMLYYEHYWYACNSSTNSLGYAGPSVRPVVSVKYDTFIKSGDGSSSDPYTLEW